MLCAHGTWVIIYVVTTLSYVNDGKFDRCIYVNVILICSFISHIRSRESVYSAKIDRKKRG